MKILFVVGQLFPVPSNNTRLISKLIELIALSQEVRILSLSSRTKASDTETVHGVPVYYLHDTLGKNRLEHFFASVVSSVVDPAGYSDHLLYRNARKRIAEIEREFPFEWIISTSEPFTGAVLSARSCVKSVLYMMDPPERICGGRQTVYRNRMLPKVLKGLQIPLTRCQKEILSLI